MTVAIFANCAFFLRVKKLTIQEKNRLKNCIQENDGQIKFVLNQKCTHVVTDDADALSSTHLKAIQKYQLPVVDPAFIWNSVKERSLLQTDNYEPQKILMHNTVDVKQSLDHGDNYQERKDATVKNGKNESCDSDSMDGLRCFSKNDENIPCFSEDFEIAKYDILEKVTAHGEYVIIELQCFQQQCDYPFRIYIHYSVRDGKQLQTKSMPVKTSEKARRIYVLCIEDLEKEGFQLRKDFPSEAEYLASGKLQEMLVAEAITSSTLSEDVATFVELVWIEALGLLNLLLAKPVTSISLNDVSRAEGVLLRVKKALHDMKSPNELSPMMLEFYKIIPHKGELNCNVNMKLLSKQQDLCQLIRDMLNVQETNMLVPNPSSLSKYRALRCRIDALDANTEEFHKVKRQVDQNTSECPVKILQIYKVGRITEAAAFESHLGNIQSLIHSSSPSNFVGILSRGLLLPKMAVEEHGLQRTDCGNLGSGIYFSNSISTSIRYSQPSTTDGSRLLVICDVALGTCWDTCQTNSSLTAAPPGYDSVHGISRKKDSSSAFEGDEFVVYKTNQVKIKYVVKFSLTDDRVKEFHPVIQTELEDQMPSHDQSQPEDYEMPSQNKLDNVTAGLLDGSGNQIPLKEVLIKGRIIDFVAEVVVFQTYENQTGSPIEAKYVFPLDDTAAVCGFEAFIKEKHIIGEVKEKEKAHQEYRDAVSRGDGAYLMDQDAPDIFTVSVGNLPPSTKVLIKITYITELIFENGCLSFHMPATVAPWQQDKALNEITQDSVKKVIIKQLGSKAGEFYLEMSLEMPFKINCISSWTHQLRIKKTDCKAIVRTIEGSSLDTNGFVMEIEIGDVHLPRMWVEKHPDKKSEACMLVFQPEFEAPLDPLSPHGEIIICLDCSNSMAGSEIQQAKQIALYFLDSYYVTEKLTVIKFGTNFVECPYDSEDFKVDYVNLEEFIMSATATMGNSDLWKTLHYLSLLYPSKEKRNILLISDGHIQNEAMTLQLVKQNAKHTRIFTCGVGPAANRHMLRSLSHYGAGAFEYFDAKSKYNWERKVRSQKDRMSSPGCNAVSIKWQQFDTNAPELTYAPAQIQSLFNHEHLLVYGFISNCTQATLHALIDNQELQTMVSTTELQKTTGTMLHKLAARAFIRDYEQGVLHENETEHEMKKQELKSLIIKLSLENSIVTQFTSFVAIEKRTEEESQIADTMNVLELVTKEDVDILPYMQYQEPELISHLDLQQPQDTQLLQTCLDELTNWVSPSEAQLSEADFLSTLSLLPSDLSIKDKKLSPQEFVALQPAFCPGVPLKGLPLADDTWKLGEHLKDCGAFQKKIVDAKPKPVKKEIQISDTSSVLPRLHYDSMCIDSPVELMSEPIMLQCGFQRPPPPAPLPPRPLPPGFQFSSSWMDQKMSSVPTNTFDPNAPLNLQTSTHRPASSSSHMMSFLEPCNLSIQNVRESSLYHETFPNVLRTAEPPDKPIRPTVFGFGSAYSPWTPQAYGASVKMKAPGSHLPPPPLLPLTGELLRQKKLTSQTALFGSTHAPGLQVVPPPCGLGLSDMIPEAPMDLKNYQNLHQSSSVTYDRKQLIHADVSKQDSGLEALLMWKEPGQKKKEVVDEEELASEVCHRVCMPKKTLSCIKFKKKLKRGTLHAQMPLNVIFWPQLFKLQNEDGFWQLTAELGNLLDIDVDLLINVTLAKKGIQSLGPKGKEKLLQLIATLLVLQAVRFKQLEGLIFKSLTKLNDSPLSWASDPVKKAIAWTRKTEREFPAICQRLELGKDWDSATKKILGIDVTEAVTSPFYSNV